MSIYDKALQTIRDAKQISGNIDIHRTATKSVYIRQSNFQLFLVYQDKGKTEQVKCGFYSPQRGWIFSLDRDTYRRWVERTGHTVGTVKPVAPRLMCSELRQEWRACGGV